MHRIFAVASAVIAVATLASAGPKFLSKWSSPEARGVSFAGKKVAAVVMSQDDSLRVSGEEALSHELTARGMQGVAAYRMIPKEELQNPDKAKGWFERAAVEGVVVLRPVSAEKERTYTEPTVWAAPYYGSLWGLLRVWLGRDVFARLGPGRHGDCRRDADLQRPDEQAALGSSERDEEPQNAAEVRDRPRQGDGEGDQQASWLEDMITFAAHVAPAFRLVTATRSA
jgi:hypothetical protein